MAAKTTDPRPTPDPAYQALVDQAAQDLAKRLSIDIDQIELVEFKAVVWPDASLGCPQPGMLYKQVPQDGALIRLSARGQIYEYHSGGNRAPFLCAPDSKVTDREPKIKLDIQTPPPIDE